MKQFLFLISFFLLITSAQAQSRKLEATETKALLNVIVTDFEENPLPNEIVIFTSANSGRSVRKKTNRSGKFSILLPEGDAYTIKYENLVEDREYKTIDIPDRPGYMEADLRVMLKATQDEVFELDIHFKTAEATILPTSYKNLDHLARKMKEKPDMRIEVAGHTDDVGTQASNQKLSENRARSVRAYLAGQGIDPKRIETVGYGEDQPVASNDTDEGRAHNRRTEIRVMD